MRFEIVSRVGTVSARCGVLVVCRDSDRLDTGQEAVGRSRAAQISTEGFVNVSSTSRVREAYRQKPERLQIFDLLML